MKERLQVIGGTAVRRRGGPAPPVEFRPFRAADRAAVFGLLSVLPSLYPGGHSWLGRRLDDVLDGRARCTLAICHRRAVGVTIETPKGACRLKLSTIYVHPSCRGLGVGTGLLERGRDGWLREGADAVHVTVDVRRAGLLLPIFGRFGFRVGGVEAGRYGEDRDEMILSWSPDRL